MVNIKEGLAAITWEEDMAPEDVSSVSDAIVSAITAALKPPAAESHRLFFVVPTPVPYSKAESALFSAFKASGKTTGKLRAVTLDRKGRCYLISGEQCFKMLLPHVFNLGPPEFTFIAGNCKFDFSAEENTISGFVLGAIKGEPCVDCDFQGLHFDSGDLIESF
jgi:hypothetical protein